MEWATTTPAVMKTDNTITIAAGGMSTPSIARRDPAEEHVQAGVELAIEVGREDRLSGRRHAREFAVDRGDLRELSRGQRAERLEFPEAESADVEVTGVVGARLRVGAESGVGEGGQRALDHRQRRGGQHPARECQAVEIRMPAGHVADRVA